MQPLDQHTAARAEKTLSDLRDVARRSEQLDGPALIGLAVTHTQTQADLARLSGLTGNTITAIKRGKRPSAAQRSAILWAIARATGI